MRQHTIQAIDLVSDGIVVQFSDGTRCYYPATFLLENVHTASNQLLLDYDPTPAPKWDIKSLEAFCAPTGLDKARVC